ncbi:T9SS type B sorting domain-containing protein [Polaribacter sp. IC073]|uniref:Ig-like domain-containing protein n=1 Tax=Polaribacter sp. IC073 TaxID=2508540 RepID=UPI0011BED188|nr:T9SS type B sorting domain-containing protein [Polaribacter sp. IC073]TXD47716.1 T9SS type B sorting domain-containing protein [Polaribacter sp. IC073]
MIKLSIKTKYKTLVFFSLFFISFFSAQTDSAPQITAVGEQAFCIGSPIDIVTDFTISDLDDTGVAVFYIQISSGYQINSDKLALPLSYSASIKQVWNDLEGKLILTPIGRTEISHSELKEAVEDVFFTTTATNVTQKKTFSLTIDDANYLPSTDHFYEFVSEEGITWTDAKNAAENRPLYYGRQGYLATLTSQEEADFAGKQASGSGWIGGNDIEEEGVWKWVTGPEAGTIFWNGKANGSSPAGKYAKWNNNEPNNAGQNEHYAHITDPSIGISGAWNDLPNGGGARGPYFPKGYIVEYGTPGDLPLNIVATTNIYIPQISSTTEAIICESGIATISATPSEGIILWFDAETGGMQLPSSGNSYTTPLLTSSKIYYAAVSVDGCSALERTAVNVTVNKRPVIRSIKDDLICSGSGDLMARTSAGEVNWYASETSMTSLYTGENFTTLPLTSTTSYYAEANIDGCISAKRTKVTVTVDATIPYFELEKETYVLCNDIGSVTLKTINFEGNYTYNWTKDTLPLSSNTSEINVNEVGRYKVKAVSKAGCESDEKIIIVRNSEIATITKENVIITENSSNNSIQIVPLNLGIGIYEFSIDEESGSYTTDVFFENLSPGIHTLFVADKGGCGIAEYRFSILEYPKFFSPNGDGVNDFWEINGYHKDFYTTSSISIYNRFGVLLFTIDEENRSWDGTYQGKELPSNSYWFSTILTDINGVSIEKIGYFSLLRK